jgi:hypothetical protein
VAGEPPGFSTFIGVKAKLLTALSLSAALGFPASPAYASAYTDVLHAYESSGTVAPCSFSSAQLAAALKGVDTYGAQYFQDFTNAIQAALSARASGACSGARQTPRAQRSAGSAAPGTPTGDATSAGVPLPLLLLASFGGLLALAAASAGIARWRGLRPRWAQAWNHSWREAGFRTSSTWAEFVDWVRSME